MASGHLVVYGGKPFSPLLDGSSGTLTNSAMRELFRRGFYDVHILALDTFTWRRIEIRTPSAPLLWGHTAVAYGSNCILVHGGLDVSPAPGARETDPPEARLNPDIFSFNLKTLQWGRCTNIFRKDVSGIAPMGVGPPSTTPKLPPARAMHVAQIRGDELVIFGGFRFAPHNGMPEVLNDCWVWDATSNVWKEMEFCLDRWDSAKLISVMYYDQLVVANQLNKLFFFDMRTQGPWQGVTCFVDSKNWIQHSPLGSGMKPAKAPHYPTSASEYMSRVVNDHKKGALGEPLPPPDDEPSEAELLKMQVQHLKGLLALKETEGTSRNIDLRNQPIKSAEEIARERRRAKVQEALGQQEDEEDRRLRGIAGAAARSMDPVSPKPLEGMEEEDYELPPPRVRSAVESFLQRDANGRLPYRVSQYNEFPDNYVQRQRDTVDQNNFRSPRHRTVSPPRVSHRLDLEPASPRLRSESPPDSPTSYYGSSIPAALASYRRAKEKHKAMTARRRERIAQLQKRLAESNFSDLLPDDQREAFDRSSGTATPTGSSRRRNATPRGARRVRQLDPDLQDFDEAFNRLPSAFRSQSQESYYN